MAPSLRLVATLCITLAACTAAARSAGTAAVASRWQQVATPLAGPCFSITCAQIECVAPLALRRLDDQCCPICWAPDHEIGLDRHTSLQGHNPHLQATHPA